MSDKNALVVVFGNVSQSPRMVNHAKSLVEAGYKVKLLGYASGRKRIGDGIQLVSIPSFFERRSNVLGLRIIQTILAAFFRILAFLIIGLFGVGEPQLVLVQNPPSIPTLLVAPIISKYHKALYVIDWHNLGFTLLSLNYGARSKVATWAKKLELYLAKFADKHFTVTLAMKDWLEMNCHQIKSETVHVLMDRPTHDFKHLTLDDKHRFLERFFSTLDDEGWGHESHATFFNETKGQAEYLADAERQTALVVSSTSWTADENFEVLWKAILACEDKLAKQGPRRNSFFPTILLVITGKGPLREHYEDLFRSQRLFFFKIKTMWLDSEDYPKLLASADLGLSMHTSSSGLDLPMKVVDMMGCGLPVLAHTFECIGELIEDGVNGLLFEDSEDLSEQILQLFHGFPKSTKVLKGMGKELMDKPLMAWKGTWNKVFLGQFPPRPSPHPNNSPFQ